jgi:uncharacterized protein DUF6134
MAMVVGRRVFMGGLIGAAAGMTVSSLRPAPAYGALATPQSLKFNAYRGTSQVGTHAVSVMPAGNQTKVHVAIDMKVSAAFITLFAFKHEGEEIWQDGRLVGLSSRTDDNGDAYQVTGQATADGFRIEGPGGPALARADTFTSNSVWNTALLRRATAVDVQHGGIIGLSVKPEGREAIAVAGATLPASKYQFVTPFIAGSVWYDSDGRWVKALFERDGEEIEYRLEA